MSSNGSHSEMPDLPDSSCSDRPGDRSKVIEDHPARMGSKSIRQRRMCDLPEQIRLVYRHDAPHPVRRLEAETGIVLVLLKTFDQGCRHVQLRANVTRANATRVCCARVDCSKK